MNRITFSTTDCNTNETISVWLASIIQANMLSMEQFPDQSQINRLLTRTDEESVLQLTNIHNQLFIEHSHSIHSPEPVVVDIDQSGLLASGKTYEFASKGYFPNKTGKKSYQLSVAFAGEHSEVVDLYLDPGNTHCQYRFDYLLSSIASKYIDHLKAGKLTVRLDGGYGSLENIEREVSGDLNVHLIKAEVCPVEFPYLTIFQGYVCAKSRYLGFFHALHTFCSGAGSLL